MAEFILGPFLALDPTQTGAPIAKAAAGKLYATDGITLLPMRDLAGVPLTDAVSDASGIVQGIKVDNQSEAIWISGSYRVPVRSFGGVLDEAKAAKIAAEAAAVSAADAASNAVTDSSVAAIVTTPGSATATAIKALAGSPVLILEAGEPVPPGTPAGTLIVHLGDPGPTIYGADAFERTLAQGWGFADLGGPWTLSQTNAFRVESGAGIWNAPAANTRAAWLAEVTPENADIESLFTTTAIDHAQLIRFHLRRTASNAGYQVAMLLQASSPGTIALKIDANATEIQGYSPNVITDYTPGTLLRIRLRVVTTAPGQTTIQARLWKNGTAEPAVWHRTIVDTTAALQANGGFAGVSGYTGGSTVTPVEIKVHDFKVVEAV